jgi:hypothetical protein
MSAEHLDGALELLALDTSNEAQSTCGDLALANVALECCSAEERREVS